MSSEIVIREVTTGVWTFSKPFARFGLIPFGGRSTAVKLSTGGVWVVASTPLSKETKETLDKLGPVQWIVSPDAVHHLFLDEFKTAYPEAKVIATADAIKRHGNPSLKVDGVWGKDAADAKYGFEDDIEWIYFDGFANKDVAFLHKASKTLIEADLLFNLPAKEQYSKTKSSGSFPLFKNLNPYHNFHTKFLGNLAKDKVAMKRDAQAVANWDFDRIIPCHGDVVETGGKKAWQDVYKKILA
ncbi:hypothetical protein CYLTODRAFT_416374 [Cylindrobasidium torrendii FP15055 ss-10]|uniref:DUF4336 domain-containing protein n=1 Tax=Cylindrobasidium torrendii FP15055 ss-10 TaxID=1314674 RepID=A0A0D7BVA2_9AGAR|nr:hypothetical protein CYLTODRAFT_416374 [Cylindrobasidium torrendii FP15055 ss-10]